MRVCSPDSFCTTSLGGAIGRFHERFHHLEDVLLLGAGQLLGFLEGRPEQLANWPFVGSRLAIGTTKQVIGADIQSISQRDGLLRRRTGRPALRSQLAMTR